MSDAPFPQFPEQFCAKATVESERKITAMVAVMDCFMILSVVEKPPVNNAGVLQEARGSATGQFIMLQFNTTPDQSGLIRLRGVPPA